MDTACNQAIVQAIGYIGKKTNHWTSEQHHHLRHDPDFRTHEARVYATAATGNADATKAACRAWWTYVLAYTPTEKETA